VKNTDTAIHKGYDAGKKVSGIKRHIAVDTLGLPHALALTTADVTDRAGALQAFLYFEYQKYAMDDDLPDFLVEKSPCWHRSRIMKERTNRTRHRTLDTINALIKNYGNRLSCETLDFVSHYCGVDEYEMAFEILLTDSIKEDMDFDIDFKKIIFEIALELNLDKESIFNSNFWDEFLSFMV